MGKKLSAASRAPPHRREDPRAAPGHQRESRGTSGAAYTSPERPVGSARPRFEISGAGKGLMLLPLGANHRFYVKMESYRGPE